MDYIKENQKITSQTRSTLYHELYDYIQNTYDARPSTTKKVIDTLPAVIESLVNETEENRLKIISKDFKPGSQTVDVLY